jgi:hypothetical protein
VIVLSTDQQKSVLRLSGNPDWERFCLLIADTYERELDNLLRSTNPVTVHQQQGICQLLKDILQAIKPANPSPSGRLA